MAPRPVPGSPADHAPARRQASVRRTTTHDSTRPDGLDGPVTLVARGRDLRTGPDGSATVLDHSTITAVATTADGMLSRIDADPAVADLGLLVGRTAYAGFRRACADTLSPSLVNRVCFQLLDDLPIALLLSGRVLRAAGIPLRRRDPDRPAPVDICAGWVEGGELLAGLTRLGPPITEGPLAPLVETADDERGWHHHDALPPDSTRRRRRVDVWVEDGVGRLDAFFRDSHADGRGVERVVHEYGLRADVELGSTRVLSCTAMAGPLPYVECPGAAASAERLVGAPVHDLRRRVLLDLTGPTTCTHLNDMLRSLADVGHLLEAADPSGSTAPPT